MKPALRLLQNLGFGFLMLCCIAGLYLYAKNAEQSGTDASALSTSAVPSALPAPVPAQTLSTDGRLASDFFGAFSEAGFTLQTSDDGDYALFDADMERKCTMAPSLRGERVSGLTLSFSLPEKPVTAKSPSLIEQALLDRYASSLAETLRLAQNVFGTALDALDPYGEVPDTTRRRWRALIEECGGEGRSASDAAEALRLHLYYDGEETLCIALERKPA